MGRPLNKKFFGNRNVGVGGNQITGDLSNSQNYADDRIGGEGVASYSPIVTGSGWTTIPTVTFSAPDIPGGVSVAGTAHYKALSFATTANGTGYAVGDILEVDTGTQTTKARAPVAAILSVATPNITNGGTLYDITDVNIGDLVTFTHANLTTALRVRITAVDESTATGIAVEQAGVWNGTTFPSSMAGGVGGFTATTTARVGGDANGTGLVLGFTASMWGAYSFGTVGTVGDYTVFPSTGASGTLTSVSPATGTGAKADITMGLLSVAVTQRGSGYTSPVDAQVTFSGGTGAVATAVLTTDSGLIGSATNQENAIVIRAKIDSEATVRIGDIIKQSSGRRYKVKTQDGIAVCKLVADDTPATLEAYIKATDANGNTYFVTKLTARKVVLTQWSNNESTWLFATGTSAPWSFTTTANGRVIIENA
jgi:hypothetical protein